MSSLTLEYGGQPVDLLALMRHITQHEIAAQYSPWFSTYYADLTGEQYLSKYVRFLRGFLSMCPGGITGRTVLDAGCGFGIMSTLVSLMGAREVKGIDCNQGMIETFQAYLGILPFELPITPQVGDVAELPYEDETFDVVLSHEAVSHYPDVDAFMAETYRVLRPGGVLLLSDSNNALNRQVREDTWEIWRAFELGPAGIRVHGHTIDEPFVAQRARIIRELGSQGKLPPLNDSEIELLAQHTSGLAGDELWQAANSYAANHVMPEHAYQEGTCPIDPVQGYYIEYLFDPYELQGQLERVGFSTRLRAYLGGARGPVLATVNRALTWEPLTPLVLPYARAFRIAAVKRAR